jgi:aspartate dehydrogenase
MSVAKRRVGIVGYGSLGKFLYDKITKDEKAQQSLEVAFVWNRTPQKCRDDGIPENLILEDLDQFTTRPVDIIVEVAHPQITVLYGERFLKHADFYIGSPTAFADADVESRVRVAAIQNSSGKGLYIPSGALWAAEDIKKMADGGSLKGLIITMKKHPQSLKLTGQLAEKLKETQPGVENVLYEGT